ncbi:putative purine-cytosine permease fcy22 protein [Phaeoacremonium minimum UCRPA7]|uniref:Putative purine-cytosine permease fcy22 protein n=1 Tax=Phaeoacremonium minimum (strain UCR-PA7) TaxID=1286976 RepID=R8BXI6_PHAM7|nr:putative purine-cytosine permease fcy22 protein [Phaeoacremonium minimum UCRPA7]EOO03989.1 putative purine-cytosine permease fcy22 protein [Phaeoacremonium minimum UCRPA7]
MLVAVGCGGKHLHKQVDAPEATASSVLSFAALIAGFFLPWSAIASDFTTYFDRRSKKASIFVPSYIGLVTGAIPLMILGAAIGGAVPNVPSWEEGYNTNNVGGVLGAMLEPSGGFGKFLLVLLALSVLGNVVGSIYALTLNFQALLFLVRIRIPRIVYTIIATAIIIPVAIKVAANFFDSLSNFLGIIGYWPAAFVAVIVLEHLVFRKGKAENYDLTQWETARGLPTGLAALGAAVLCFGMVIPGMAQIWYTGPIAVHTGDIGFEMAFALTAALYVPFRFLEVKLLDRI